MTDQLVGQLHEVRERFFLEHREGILKKESKLCACLNSVALTSVSSGAFYKKCLQLASECEFYIFKLFINLQFFFLNYK